MKQHFQRTGFALVTLAVLALAACSHKPANQGMLGHVPADTPYAFVNQKPIDADAVAGMLAASNAQMSTNATQYHDMAKHLRDDLPHVASLLNALGDELQNHATMQELLADAGIQAGDRFVWYGLGLSPVLRMHLAEPAKFAPFVTRLAKQADMQLSSDSINGVDYRYVAFPDNGLEWIVAQRDETASMALLPAQDNQQSLRLVLGIDHPDDNIMQRMDKLAHAHGADSTTFGFVDTARLLADLSSGEDPLVNAFVAQHGDEDDDNKLAALASPACQQDLARIAARAPELTVRYTNFEPQHVSMRAELHLADNISAAFADLQPVLAGLGMQSPAALDFAAALPLPAIHDFWVAQAKAVAAKPFSCQPLTGLNKAFAKIPLQAGMLAVPPWGNLRGVRLSVDKISPATDAGNQQDASFLPDVDAHMVVAVEKPEQVLGMVKAMFKPLQDLELKADGKPVALPDTLTSFTNEPAWLAMGKQGFALGIGEGEKDKLSAMLSAEPGSQGQLLAAHLEGQAMAKWMQGMARQAAQHAPAGSSDDDSTDDEDASQADVSKALQSAARAYRYIKAIDYRLGMQQDGLVLHVDVQTTQPQD